MRLYNWCCGDAFICLFISEVRIATGLIYGSR